MRFALVQLLLASAWLGVAGPSGLAAQPAPLGPEVWVRTDSFPGKPVVAAQPGGDYVIAWDDYPQEVYYRYVVAGTEPADEYPLVLGGNGPCCVGTDAVTATPKGFDVVWHFIGDDYKPAGFFRRHLNLHGQRDGKQVQLGRAGTDWIWNVRGNGFMAGWALPKAHGIAARRLSSSGQLTGPELRLNSRPVDAPDPLVLAVADGGFVAVWLGTVPGSTATPVLRARRFSPAGKPLGPDFDVNNVGPVSLRSDTYTEDPGFLVAAAPGGGFAVAWERELKIYLRFFDAVGKALGPEIPAVTAEDTWALASMAFDDAGELLLSWAVETEIYRDLQIQLFDSQGSPLGPPELVRTEASGDYLAPWQGSVAWTGSSWLVAWVATGVPGLDFNGVFVRRFAGH
jgi:hypothetical protein